MRHPHPSYGTMIRHIQRQLRPAERRMSRFIHQNQIERMSNFLEKSIFRMTPLFIASSISLVVGVAAFLLAFIFNYQIISFNFLGPVFLLGFIIGATYEYIHSLWKRP